MLVGLAHLLIRYCGSADTAQRKRAPTEADAPLDNEDPTTTYLSVAASPTVTGSPVEPEKSRAARAGLLHARALFLQCANFLRRPVLLWADAP